MAARLSEQKPLTLEAFEPLLKSCLAGLSRYHSHKIETLAVGVSGGPDSMALCRLLSLYAQRHGGPEILALTVDHGLRPESAAEAAQVARWLDGWPHVRHKIVRWEGEKPQSGIHEAARAARYRLMAGMCAHEGISALLLAHHEDDQAETFLFRLAKGSGLDGLAAMQPVQPLVEGLVLLRPLLAVAKSDLLEFCRTLSIPYVDDPSNEAHRFARPRLRAARAALEAEGLSSKRVAVTAARLARARKALEILSEKADLECILIKDTKRIVYNFNLLKLQPEEIVLRVVLMSMEQLSAQEGGYGPRLERVENLCADLLDEAPFRKRTLGGVVFRRDDKRGLLEMIAEAPAEQN